MANRQTRRRYLLALGAVGATGLAGCSESESDTAESDTDATSTATDSDSLSASASAEAEATLRRYLEAYATGDAETVGELTHPESVVGTETNPVELTIDEISTVTLSAVAEEIDIELSDDELEAAEAAIAEQTTDIGAEQYATVRYDIETPEYGAESGYVLLVREDGEWYFYNFRVESYLYEANEPEDTGGSTDDRMPNRLQEVSSVGTDISGGAVGSVVIIVKRAPGADDIDLSATVVQFVHSSGSTDLTFGSTGGTGSATTFGVQSIQDEGETSIVGDSPTLDDPADRARLVLDAGAVVGSGGLTGGDTATVRLTTQSGGTTDIRLVVPESLDGAAAVNL
jgi:flagellin FlaB